MTAEQNWRKSTRSMANGNCVEAANWRKSTRSGYNGNCVEAASASGVLVRDTADRGGATLQFSADTWTKFTASLKAAPR